MLLASWPLQDFAGFLQIISWITIPVLLFAVLFTVILHYYQRRKKPGQPGNPEISSLAFATPADRYDRLREEFENLQQAYFLNEVELNALNGEMKRQDWVIEELRTNLVSLEKNLSTLRLALQLKDEQLKDLRIFVEESNSAIHSPSRQAVIAAEIS